MWRRLRGAAMAGALVMLAGCQADELGYGAKAERPLPYALKAEMTGKDMTPADPILVRLFKEENTLEVWKRTKTGKYALLKDYDICKWSGELGPKFKEGDRQAPEGFYTIRPAQMNPHSSYHLAFNMGFPNAYDRAHGRTGSHLMVHGACSSRGCYAMTDEQIQEIYILAREAFRGGQRDFQVQALPFRMTAENMARHADNPHMPFWRMLKVGYDHFELTRQVPKVDVCDKGYVFNADPEDDSARFIADRQCPAYQVPEPIRQAVAAKQRRDDEKTAMIVAQLEEKRARQEKWENREKALAGLLGGSTSDEASGKAGTAPAAETASPAAATPVLAYAPGTPVPAPNPERPASAAPADDSRGGFFSSLFTGDDTPRPGAALAAPAPAPASASETSAPAAETATTPAAAPPANGTPPVPAPVPDRQAEDAAPADGSRVSDLVSRWFSFGKKN